MVSLNVQSNVKQWSRRMAAVERKQVPFATAVALTKTAKDVERNTLKLLDRRLDRPTPFTKRGLFVKAANKHRLVAKVGFKPIQAAYLDKPERGGTRKPKGRAIIVPASQRLNRYGNLPKGSVQRLLARDDTFSGEVRGVPGIWQRNKKGGLKLLIAYVERATYKPQLRFQAGAMKTARARFPIQWRRAFESAVRTAR